MYYFDGRKIDTPALQYGSYIHDLIEKNDSSVSHVPRYDWQEKHIAVEVEGVPLFGKLDSFRITPSLLVDYKTGMTPWNDVKVRKHDQLPFYAMLLYYKYGVEMPMESQIVWIETKKQDGPSKGIGENRDIIETTGKVVEYPRTIERYEIDLQVERVIKVAREISNDYKDHVSKISL